MFNNLTICAVLFSSYKGANTQDLQRPQRNKEKHCNSPPKNPGFSVHPLSLYYQILCQVLPLQIKHPRTQQCQTIIILLSLRLHGAAGFSEMVLLLVYLGLLPDCSKMEAGDREQRFE